MSAAATEGGNGMTVEGFFRKLLDFFRLKSKEGYDVVTATGAKIRSNDDKPCDCEKAPPPLGYYFAGTNGFLMASSEGLYG